jgi:hypothetical protein
MSAIEETAVGGGSAFKGRFKVNQTNTIDFYIQRLFYFQNQTKLFHWNAEFFGQHTALDTLYDELLEITDKFVESFMGTNSSKASSRISIEIQSGGDVLKFLDDMRREIGGWRLNSDINATALDNPLQDLEAKIENTIYLYRLK